jgi:predicted transcriptional regulator
MKRGAAKAKIIKLIRQGGMSAGDIADKLGTSVSYIYMVRKEMIKDVLTTDETRLKNAVAQARADMVNHPPHYTAGGIETIDFIEAKKLGYNLGNVVKYITRSDLKGDRLENLKKAQWYLNREVNNMTKDSK